MFKDTQAFSGFAVDDLDKARQFYGETLGIETQADEGIPLFTLQLAGDRPTMVYHSPEMTPPSYTILNFRVDDIESAVQQLAERGVELEHYEGLNQDERGIARGIAAGMGPDIAWFKDPAGNILSVVQDPA